MRQLFLVSLIIIFMGVVVGCSARSTPETNVLTAVPTRVLPTLAATAATPLPTATNVQAPLPTPTMTATFSSQDFENEQIAPVCTELGCNDSVQVHFEGFQPDRYLVEVIDQNDDKLILHCFPSDPKNDSSYDQKEFDLTSPLAIHYQAISPALEMCGEGEPALVNVTTRGDNSVDQIVVYCGNWIEYASDPYFQGFADCHLSPEEFVIFYDTKPLPETLSVLVSGDTFTKTFAIEPQYEAYWPNGPACEPECFQTYVSLPLP